MKNLYFFIAAVLLMAKSNAQVVSLTSPTIAVSWQQGTFNEVKWNATNVPFVDVMVSFNNGLSYSLVQASVPSNKGLVLYSPSGADGTQAVFKVKSSQNSGITSSQSAVVTFSNPGTSAIINTPTLAASYCAGRTYTVSYSAVGPFQTGNTFMLISSDASGNFNNAIQLGKLTSTVTAGVISFKFPEDYMPSPGNNILKIVSDRPLGQSNQVIATVTNFSATVTTPSTTIYSQSTLNQNFNCAGNLAGVTSYTWSYGDGSSGNTQNSSHTYSNYGNYSVSLRMLNAAGCVQLINKPYLINLDPLFGSIATIPASPVFNANDVSYLNKDTAVAVGKNGMAWKSFDGGYNWNVMPTFPGTKSNNAVIMKGRYICIAGDTGTVTFSNDRGVSWANSAQAQPLINYQDVNFADTTFGVAVGQAGDAVIYKWVGGLGWQHNATGLPEDLHAVAAFKTSPSIFTDGEAMAVGDNGVITKYASGSWNASTSPTTINLKGIYLFPNNLDVIVCGDNGLIMRSPDYGNTWSVIQNGTAEALNDVTPGVVPNQIIIVGDNGVIYESLDNGFTYTRYTSGFPSAKLTGTSSKSPKGAFAGSGGTLRMFGTDSVKLLPLNGPTILCAVGPLKVKFNLVGAAFTPTFTANLVLSDNTGDFFNSTILNSKVNPNSFDSIIGMIPTNLTDGNYRVRIDLTGNNSLYSAPSTETLTIYALPNPVTFTVSGTQIQSSPDPGGMYLWYYNNSVMSGQTSTIVTTIGNGYYKRLTTNIHGCKRVDSVLYNTTGINEILTAGKPFIYPNPANKLITIKLPNTEKHFISIYNALGKMVLNKEITSLQETFDIEFLKQGLYFVYIKDEENNINTLKFIKQ